MIYFPWNQADWCCTFPWSLNLIYCPQLVPYFFQELISKSHTIPSTPAFIWVLNPGTPPQILETAIVFKHLLIMDSNRYVQRETFSAVSSKTTEFRLFSPAWLDWQSLHFTAAAFHFSIIRELNVLWPSQLSKGCISLTCYMLLFLYFFFSDVS